MRNNFFILLVFILGGSFSIKAFSQETKSPTANLVNFQNAIIEECKKVTYYSPCLDSKDNSKTNEIASIEFNSNGTRITCPESYYKNSVAIEKMCASTKTDASASITRQEMEEKTKKEYQYLADYLKAFDITILNIANYISEDSLKEVNDKLKDKTNTDIKTINVSLNKKDTLVSLNSKAPENAENTIDKLNVDKLTEVNKIIDGTNGFLGTGIGSKDGESDSLMDLVNIRIKYEKYQNGCISTSNEAELNCDIAKSPNGKRSRETMDQLSTSLQTNQSASSTLNATAVASSAARDYTYRAQIRCGTDLSIAENTCKKADKLLKKFQSKLDALQSQTAKIKTPVDIYLGKLNEDLGTCLNKEAKKEICEEPKTEATLKVKIDKYKEINIIASTEKILKEVQLLNDLKKVLLDFVDTKNKSVAALNGPYADHGKLLGTLENVIKNALESKEKLTSTSASGGAATTVTQMCADPANATNVVCKCRTDNTAPGCPGFISSGKLEGNIDKTLGGKGAAGMAGFNAKSSIKPMGSVNDGLGNLSDEAKKVLATTSDSDKNNTAPSFGTAAQASSGGGGGGSSGATGSAAQKGKITPEESKSIGSSFVSAVNSFFRSNGPSGKLSATNDKINSDKYKEQIKRQIASEQMKSEISSASGVDNFSKIKTRYKSNSSSLIDNN